MIRVFEVFILGAGKYDCCINQKLVSGEDDAVVSRRGRVSPRFGVQTPTYSKARKRRVSGSQEGSEVRAEACRESKQRTSVNKCFLPDPGLAL